MTRIVVDANEKRALMLRAIEKTDNTPEDKAIILRFLTEEEYLHEILNKVKNGEEIPAVLEKYCFETLAGLRRIFSERIN